MSLSREGLIERDKRHVHIPNWESPRRVAGFSEVYLHIDQDAGLGRCGLIGPVKAAAR